MAEGFQVGSFLPLLEQALSPALYYVIPATAGTQGSKALSALFWVPDILLAQNSGMTVGGTASNVVIPGSLHRHPRESGDPGAARL